MQKIDTSNDLSAAILLLEESMEREGVLLKKEFQNAYESIKPINIIKSTFTEVAELQDVNNNLLNTGIGLATGYISKSLFESVTSSPLRKLVGAALMFGITNIIIKNPQIVTFVGNGLKDMIKYTTGTESTESETPLKRLNN